MFETVIRGGRILDVGSGLDLVGDLTIDAQGRVVAITPAATTAAAAVIPSSEAAEGSSKPQLGADSEEFDARSE